MQTPGCSCSKSTPSVNHVRSNVTKPSGCNEAVCGCSTMASKPASNYQGTSKAPGCECSKYASPGTSSTVKRSEIPIPKPGCSCSTRKPISPNVSISKPETNIEKQGCSCSKIPSKVTPPSINSSKRVNISSKSTSCSPNDEASPCTPVGLPKRLPEIKRQCQCAPEPPPKINVNISIENKGEEVTDTTCICSTSKAPNVKEPKASEGGCQCSKIPISLKTGDKLKELMSAGNVCQCSRPITPASKPETPKKPQPNVKVDLKAARRDIEVNVVPVVPLSTSSGVITIPVKLLLSVKRSTTMLQKTSMIFAKNTDEFIYFFSGVKFYYEPYMDEVFDGTPAESLIFERSSDAQLTTGEFIEPYTLVGYSESRENVGIQTDLCLGSQLESTSLNSVKKDDQEKIFSRHVGSLKTTFSMISSQRCNNQTCGGKGRGEHLELDWHECILPDRGTYEILPLEKFPENDDIPVPNIIMQSSKPSQSKDDKKDKKKKKSKCCKKDKPKDKNKKKCTISKCCKGSDEEDEPPSPPPPPEILFLYLEKCQRVEPYTDRLLRMYPASCMPATAEPELYWHSFELSNEFNIRTQEKIKKDCGECYCGFKVPTKIGKSSAICDPRPQSMPIVGEKLKTDILYKKDSSKLPVQSSVSKSIGPAQCLECTLAADGMLDIDNDPVLLAMKAFEAELRPMKLALFNVHQKLKNLNMPELDFLLEDKEARRPKLQVKTKFIAGDSAHSSYGPCSSTASKRRSKRHKKRRSSRNSSSGMSTCASNASTKSSGSRRDKRSRKHTRKFSSDRNKSVKKYYPPTCCSSTSPSEYSSGSRRKTSKARFRNKDSTCTVHQSSDGNPCPFLDAIKSLMKDKIKKNPCLTYKSKNVQKIRLHIRLRPRKKKSARSCASTKCPSKSCASRNCASRK